MRSAVLLLVGVLCVGVSESAPRPQPQQGDDVFATVETGALRGVVSTSLNGTLYSKFVGIPFATPPLGDLRFRAPTPAASWTGTRDALTYGSRCPQSGRGSEDCLYVNVYVPLVNDSSPLAVMVNIHGGGYTTGSSRFRRPDFFMDKGVLLVTFNYRLGSIGFLSLQNDDIPGNAGLKDQVFALQWVKRNNAAFGGDPEKVTIFGESAGGSSTSHLFLSPAAKGLFRGAIMESGVANGNWSVEQTPREKAYRLAAALGFQTQGANDSAVAAFLRAVDHTDLTRDNSQALSDFEKRTHKGIAFSPVIEPQSDTAVVTESPGDILRDGRYNQVPVMAGVTSADGSVIVESSGILTDEAYAADMRENFTLLVGSQLPLPTVEEQTQAAVKVENFYFGEEGFSVDNTQAVYDMFSDMNFIQPTEEFARTVANTSDLPVYLYYFDYDGYGANEYGMSHAAESKYLFLSFGPKMDPNSNDGKVIELLTTLWTNFAKYGEPAPGGSPVTWEKFTSETANYLDMKQEFVTRQNLLKERMDFWKQILHQ
ncbi:juvenile hormone esterase-like [Schistocerca gregaria]|uniref:juvenile hormone esterase-like n=1 Tax=Schistocerca gregaria TaxID=7010 RepID=UPI00211E67F1|nr:juvenile hormone esterase-like [Schistocerca gregaria]